MGRTQGTLHGRGSRRRGDARSSQPARTLSIAGLLEDLGSGLKVPVKIGVDRLQPARHCKYALVEQSEKRFLFLYREPCKHHRQPDSGRDGQEGQIKRKWCAGYQCISIVRPTAYRQTYFLTNYCA